MSFEKLNLETGDKSEKNESEKIGKEEANSDLLKISDIQKNISDIKNNEKINKLFEEKKDPKEKREIEEKLQKDIFNFIEKAANNELGNQLSEFNSDNFDKNAKILENGDVEKKGLDKFEFENFTKTLDSAIDQIILLEGLTEFSEVHEESADYSIGWDNFDKSLSEKIDFQELILGEEGGEMVGEKLIKTVGNFSTEELKEMGDRKFNVKSGNSWSELSILLAKELGDGIEGGLRFTGNIPAAVVLIPRYLNYRVDINSNDIKEKTEGEIKIKELVEENPALAILDILGEKGVKIIKELGEKIMSGDYTQGDIAAFVGIIIETVVGAKGSKLSAEGLKYSTKKSIELGKKAKEQIKEKNIKKENEKLKQESLKHRPLIDKFSAKTKEIEAENLIEMDKDIKTNLSGIKNYDERDYKNVYYNTKLSGLKNRTALHSEIADAINEKGSVIIVKADIDNLGPANNGWSKHIDKMVDKGLINKNEKFIIGDFLIARKAKSFREIGSHCEEKFPGLRFRNFQEGGDEFASVINKSNLKKDTDGNILDQNGEKFSENEFAEFITEQYRTEAKKIQNETFEELNKLGKNNIKSIVKHTIKQKGQPREPGIFGKNIDVKNQLFVFSAGIKEFNFKNFKTSEKIKENFNDKNIFGASDVNYEISKRALANTDDSLESIKNGGVKGYKRNMILHANSGNLKINGKINYNTNKTISPEKATDELNDFKLDNEISDLKNEQLLDELTRFGKESKIRENESVGNFKDFIEKGKNNNDKITLDNFIRKGEFSEKAILETYFKIQEGTFKNAKKFTDDLNKHYELFIKGKIERGHYSSVRNNFDDLYDKGIIKQEDVIDIEINHAKPLNELLGHIILDKIIIAKEIIFQKKIDIFLKENGLENLKNPKKESVIFQMSKGPKTGFAFNKKMLEANGLSKKEIQKLEEKFIKDAINHGNIGLENIRNILGPEFKEQIFNFIKKNQGDKISGQKEFYEFYKNGQIKEKIFNEILSFKHDVKKEKEK